MNAIYKFYLIARQKGYFPNREDFRAYMGSKGYNSVHISRNLNACLREGLFTAKRNGWIKVNKTDLPKRWRYLGQAEDHKDLDKRYFLRLVQRKLRAMRYKATKNKGKQKSMDLSGPIGVKRLSELSGYSVGYVHQLKSWLVDLGKLKIEPGGEPVKAHYKPYHVLNFTGTLRPRKTKWSNENLSFFCH